MSSVNTRPEKEKNWCARILSVDVRGLWIDVRKTFPGLEESILIDRFLDTVVTRIKHAERMAEVAA